ncbi:hypothetical protein [Pararhizobium qamdonense]|uniref:hypothetical protein n=1 Tax=Pararhizobium qamdonense TaxID=3031126 RepID=UPI0023E2CB29|nr:hypothetical protein [Pararhizobium qamdonense]
MVDRVCIGLNNGNWIARISKPGIDVLTATSVGQFYMHEDFPSHRVLQAGSILFATNSLTATLTYPNRGFVPIIFACVGDVDSVGWPYRSGGNLIGTWAISQAPTATSCVFTRQTTSSAALYIHYAIFPMVN